LLLLLLLLLLVMEMMTTVNVCVVGESSGKASRSVATYTPGPAGMAYAQEAGTSAVSDIARAKMVGRFCQCRQWLKWKI